MTDCSAACEGAGTTGHDEPTMLRDTLPAALAAIIAEHEAAKTR